MEREFFLSSCLKSGSMWLCCLAWASAAWVGDFGSFAALSHPHYLLPYGLPSILPGKFCLYFPSLFAISFLLYYLSLFAWHCLLGVLSGAERRSGTLAGDGLRGAGAGNSISSLLLYSFCMLCLFLLPYVCSACALPPFSLYSISPCCMAYLCLLFYLPLLYTSSRRAPVERRRTGREAGLVNSSKLHYRYMPAHAM